MTPLKLRGATVHKTAVYSFSFEPGGWMIATIDDATGVFSIQSDWGNYSYRWHLDGMPKGETLTTFIARCADCHYLTDKLTGGRNYRGKIWDENATRESMRRRFVELRDGDVNEEQLAELDEALDSADWDNGATLFIERAPSFLHEKFDPLYEELVYVPEPDVLFLQDQLLPFLKTWLCENEVNATPAKVISLDKK